MAFLCSLAQAQTTTTFTGTIKDLTNTAVTTGNVTFTLQPGADTTISGTARFTPQTVTCGINGSGLVKANDLTNPCVIVNNTALQPLGTSYKVQICPAFACTASVVTYALGGSVDVTTLIPTPAQMPAYSLVDIFSNQTIGGNKTFLGIITAADVISKNAPARDVRVDGAVAGGEICGPLASSIAAVHTAGGGRIIVPLTGNLTCSSNPFAALTGNNNIEIDWGAVTVTTTAQWFINASGIVNRGIAWGSSVSNGLNAPTLIADASFPTSTALLKIGDNVSTLIFGTRFEDGWTFHCNNVAGCFVQLAGLNEKSGLRHVGIRNAGSGASAQLVLDNSVVTSGHYVLEDVDFGPVATAAMDAILAKGGAGGGEGMFNIRRVTCNQTGQAFAGVACVHVTGTSPLTGQATLSDIHAEGFADTVFFDTNGYGQVYTADCTGSCTNVLHINSSAAISATGLTASGGTNIVKNDNNGCTVPESELTLAAYFQDAGLSYIFGGASSAFGAVCSASTPRFRIASSTTSGAAGRTDFDQVYGATGSETGWRWEAPGSTDGSNAPYALKSIVNGVATQRFSFDNTGLFTATGDIAAANGRFGTSPATFGTIRIPNGGTIRSLDSDGATNDILISSSTVAGGGNDLLKLRNIVTVSPTGTIDASAGTGGLKIKDQGSCTMAAGTCSAQSLGHTYAVAPLCFVTWNGTGTLTGFSKCPSTTTTVTPASSVGTDTAVVNWFTLGS